MKAVEFKAKIKDNQIQIPESIQSKLNIIQDKEVKVILLLEDAELYDDLIFQQISQEKFLNGYRVARQALR